MTGAWTWSSSICLTLNPHDPRHPIAARLPDLLEHFFVRPSGALLHVVAVIGSLQPVHGPRGREILDHGPHQLLLAQLVSGAIQGKNRPVDLRQVRVAPVLRLARLMQ